MSLQPLFEAGKFVVTTEIGPLKGTDVTEIGEVADTSAGEGRRDQCYRPAKLGDETGLTGNLPPAKGKGA